MRILIFGAGGPLAQELTHALAAHEVIGFTHAQVDICDAAAVGACGAEYKPDILMNTAAFHRVDDCEDDIATSFAVNAVALANLARVASGLSAALVHFSTNYVFDGSKGTPYSESDAPNPQSVYAMSKLAGEQIVRRYANKYFLIRTAGVYGHAGAKSKRGNFVETMLRLARAQQLIRVVNDQVLTPTSAKDLAARVASLIGSEKYGLYHITNSGECSWHQFAREIFRLAGMDVHVEPISSAASGAKARRPTYSVLDNKALREAGFSRLRVWQEALVDYMRERNAASA